MAGGKGGKGGKSKPVTNKKVRRRAYERLGCSTRAQSLSLRFMPQRKGGPMNKDLARAVKQTKISLAERELEMGEDAITAPRRPERLSGACAHCQSLAVGLPCASADSAFALRGCARERGGERERGGGRGGGGCGGCT